MSCRARRDPPFDFVDSRLDGSAIGQRPALLREVQMNLLDEMGHRRSCRLQINLADRLVDQLVARPVEREDALLPPRMLRFEGFHRRRLAINSDEAIECGAADSEAQGDRFGIAQTEPLAIRSIQEAADGPPSRRQASSQLASSDPRASQLSARYSQLMFIFPPRPSTTFERQILKLNVHYHAIFSPQMYIPKFDVHSDALKFHTMNSHILSVCWQWGRRCPD